MNKKLSQLTEKVTSLSADDLLLVSTGGVSKSIKASTLEAPLKAYTDLKKSEVISEIEAVESSLNSEITNRQAADTNTLNSANSYTDYIASVLENSIQSSVGYDFSGDISLLQQAISAEETSRASAIGFIESSLQTILDNSIVPMQADITTLLEDLSNEVSARQAGDTSALNSAIAYIEGALLNTMANVNALDLQNLNAAKAYTDTAVAQVSPSGTSVPVGVIQMYAGTTAPTGWLLCDGSAVSRTTYSSLFSVIGNSYGAGNGSTTFNLPNPDTNVNLRLIIKV